MAEGITNFEGLTCRGISNLSMLFTPNLLSSNALAPGVFGSSSDDVHSGSERVNSGHTTTSYPDAGLLLLGIHSYQSLSSCALLEYVREHCGTLSFPEKLMLLLVYADKKAKECEPAMEPAIGWNPDGLSFIIRDEAALVKELLPLFFFVKGKFPSFTRKLYRWGFRQTTTSLEKIQFNYSIFRNEYFQKENIELMTKMRSVTAAGKKRAAEKTREVESSSISLSEPDPIAESGVKRLADFGDFDQYYGGMLQNSHSNKKQALLPTRLLNVSDAGRMLPMVSYGGNGSILQGLPPVLLNSSPGDQLTINGLAMLSKANANNSSSSSGGDLNLHGLNFPSNFKNNTFLDQDVQNSLLQLQSAQLRNARLYQQSRDENAKLSLSQAAAWINF